MATAAAAADGELPRFVVFYNESAGKYVKYVSDDGGELNQILSATGESVMNPHSRFEVEKSQTHPTMVNIRSCYNNRYLRRRSEEEWWIVAAEKKPVEDLSKWSSTLFLPEVTTSTVDDKKTVRLLHLELGRYVQWYNDDGAGPAYVKCLWANSTGTDPDEKSLFQAVDRESLAVLPRHMRFQDGWNNYLGFPDDDSPRLRFVIADKGHESVRHEIFTLPDGTHRILNVSRAAFWRRNDQDDGYVWADADADATATPETLFRAIKYSDMNPIVGLRNHGGGTCHKSERPILDALSAKAPPTFNYINMEEMVSSRRIEDIKFRLADGRVYNETSEVVLNPGKELVNETEEAVTHDVDLAYTDKKSSSWIALNTSFPQLGHQVRIQPDAIPTVGSGAAIEMAAPFQPYYVWGDTTSKDSEAVRVGEAVAVPAMSKVTVRLLATLASCDVPFTYTRFDTVDFGDGHEEMHFMDDGVYTGANYFDFKVEVSPPEPINNME